jgi:hypothetical protein
VFQEANGRPAGFPRNALNLAGRQALRQMLPFIESIELECSGGSRNWSNPGRGCPNWSVCGNSTVLHFGLMRAKRI